MKNCTITVTEFVEGGKTHTNDYRVATAITNLLCNIEKVEHISYIRKECK